MGDSNVAACPKAVIVILVISFSRFLDVDQVEKNFSGTCEFWTVLLNLIFGTHVYRGVG
jgi:hypothetical protein